MGYSIKFTHPNYDKEQIFDLTGVGEIQNGDTVKMDAAQERDFVVRNGQTVKDYFENSEMVEVTGTSELKKDEVDALLPPPEEEPAKEAEKTPAEPAKPEGGDS